MSTKTTMITVVANIEQEAKNYLTRENGSYTAADVNNLVMSYFRSKNPNYTGAVWAIVAGTLNSAFNNAVDSAYPTYNAFLSSGGNGEYFYGPDTANNVDTRHLFATMDGYFSSNNPTPDSWSGWAGDAASLAVRTAEILGDDSLNDEVYLAKVIQLMGADGSVMSAQDILADIDGAYIGTMLKNNPTMFISTAFRTYYNNYTSTRYTRFIDSFGKYYDFEAEVYNVLNPDNFTKGGVLLMSIFGKIGNTPTPDQANFTAGAFVNYVFTQAIKEGYNFD